MVVELLYQVNVRLLKQGTMGITSWQPHKPQPVGLRRLLQMCRPAAPSRVIEPLQRSPANNQRAEPPHMTGDRRRALYTSDGLTMSSRLLDSLIVQAYVDPLVYETVSALGSTYNHFIPAPDWRAINQSAAFTAGPTASSNGGASAVQRSFRVELVQLDVPAQLVGRSFGFVQLLLMVEHGWVAMGLWRDKRTLAAAEFGNSDKDWSSSSGQSAYFVFTNPPPDICLQHTDRIYALVQRWRDEETAEAVLGDSVEEHASDADSTAGIELHSASPVSVPSIPLSYSPRSDKRRMMPTMPS